MPLRYLQCQQPFWTRSTCTWWTPIRPIWILPFLDVSKSGYLKRNDVSLSLIFYPRKIPFLKRIFGDNVWLCPDTLVFQKPSFKIPRICQNYETCSRCISYCTLISKYISCQVNSKKTIKKKIYHSSSFRDERRFDPLSKIFNPIERARGKKPAQELARISDRMEKDDGVDFVWIFRRQCGDEADPCSEAENFSVEETTLTTSTTTTAGTTTSTRKVTRSRSNEIIPPPFRGIALTSSRSFSKSRKDMARLQTGINFLPCIRLFLLFYFLKLKRQKWVEFKYFCISYWLAKFYFSDQIV